LFCIIVLAFSNENKIVGVENKPTFGCRKLSSVFLLVVSACQPSIVQTLMNSWRHDETPWLPSTSFALKITFNLFDGSSDVAPLFRALL
jgi:hypothetical protein